MYDEKETKKSSIDWGKIIKRAISVFTVLILVLCLLSMVTKCTKNNNNKKSNQTKIVQKNKKDKKVTKKKVKKTNKKKSTKKINKKNKKSVNKTKNSASLDIALDKLQEATLKYETKELLPKNILDKDTVTLDYLISENFVDDIKDSENHSCDRKKSYSIIKKRDNNYQVKLTVKCGGKKKSNTIYIGCFSNCNGNICIGDKDSLGICSSVGSVNSNTSNESSNNIIEITPDNNSDINNYNNVTYNSPTTSSSVTNNNSNSNNSNNNKNTSSTSNTTVKEKKSHIEYYCNSGDTLSSSNNCISVVKEYKTVVNGSVVHICSEDRKYVEGYGCAKKYSPYKRVVYE